MKSNYSILLCILLLLVIKNPIYGQDSTNFKKWFIALPLRFTQLQSSNTMLSGVKLGHTITSRFHASLSIYHSFYLKSFKAKANLYGFDEQPRLFINCMGGEFDYYFFKSKKVCLGMQVLIGWGFMNYNLKEHNFTSRQVNYFVMEPAINLDYVFNQKHTVGFGIGYRPILSNRQIAYHSNISSGKIPIAKEFPNGLNFILTFKGFL